MNPGIAEPELVAFVGFGSPEEEESGYEGVIVAIVAVVLLVL